MIPGAYTPGIFNTIYCYFKYKSFVSPRAEVDVSKLLTMGEGTTISSFCQLKARHGELRLGRKVGLAVGCSLSPGEKGLRIGDYTMFGPYVVVISSNYRYDKLDVPLVEQGSTSKGVDIGSNVWIGGGSVVLDGASIGNNVIVGAGSVISGQVPDNVIIQGNPAKQIFRRR